jgi:hypothetical protein
MKLSKVAKDYMNKWSLGKEYVPKGLYDISEYFRLYGPIHFDRREEDGVIVVFSTNFRYGSIVTEASSEAELDRKIKDAILTAFEVPSAYAEQANVRRAGKVNEYVLA